MTGKRLAAGLLSFVLLMESSLNVVAAGADGGVFLPSASASVMQQTNLKETTVEDAGIILAENDNDRCIVNFNSESIENVEEFESESKDYGEDSGNESTENEEDAQKESTENGEDSEKESADHEEESEKESTDYEESENKDTDKEDTGDLENEDNDEGNTEDNINDNTEDKDDNNTENSISDNTTESVSDNEIESISDNELSLAAMGMEYWQQLEAQAQAKLQKIAREKNIYALVYLTDSYPVKTSPDQNADTVMSLGSGHTVQVMGLGMQWKYQEEWEETVPVIWYQVQFYENEILYTGYIEDRYLAYSDELLLQWKEQFQELFPLEKATLDDEVDFSDVEQFPASYQIYLRKLKEEYPNWMFVPMNVTYKNSNSSNYGKKRSWDECVKEQLGDYSWIYRTAPEAYRGEQIPGQPNWYYATLEGIAHYMDPRNYLTAQNIFQYELNSYNETYHTTEAVQKFLNNTFMEGVVPGEDNPNKYTHAQVIWNSGKTRKLSPFVLAARVIQEQGVNGTSAMISGTYPGYEGLYNYYNIGASGKTEEEVIKNGLSYAESMGWRTRIKALDEGADTLSNGYVSKGQDTLYLQKFDVEKSRGYLFQYMQNISAAYTEGRSMRSMYEESGVIEKAFVFKIPVFLNMPGYELQTKTLEMVKGTTDSLKVRYNGTEILEPNLKCDVQPTGIVSVSSDGTVTALENGTAAITVRMQEGDSVKELGTCVVTVISPLKGIRLEKDETDLYLYEESIESVPVLNEEGRTEYLTKAECPSERTLTVQFDPADTTDDRSIKWISENPEIVEVVVDETDSSKVKIIAKADGTAVITATSVTGEYADSINVNVHIPMIEARLSKNELTLYQGQTERLTASYFPYNTTDTVEPEWYSEHPETATVENGRIVAKSQGTAVLHAVIGPFDGQQEELTCRVNVESYKVKFMDEDGENLLTVSGEYGKELSTLRADGAQIPWELKADGKVFLGWYTQADGKGDAVTKESILYQDMTLYPYFIDGEAEFYVKPVGNLVYTGGYLKPEAEVFHKGERLTKGKDYTVSYSNNKSVGNKDDLLFQPKMIVKGKGQYSGKNITESFSILPKDISQIDIKVSDMLTSYTGKVQKMRPVVKDTDRTLQWNKDYTLEYVEMGTEAYCEAGTYVVKITGKGNYTGIRTAYITISKRILMSQAVLETIEDVFWQRGNECVPSLNMTYQGIPLVQNVDYTVSSRNNTKIGTATVVITGKGNYIGTREETFKIVGADFSKVDITGITDLEYTGEAIEQTKAEVRDESGQLLEKGADYEITYLNHTEPGRAVAIFTGKGGFEGSVKKNFKILPYDISENKQTYTFTDGSGQNQIISAFQTKVMQNEIIYDKAGAEPAVQVTFKGRELTEGVDYTLKYDNNDRVTTGDTKEKPTVIITGKGDFSGSISESFTIIPKELSEVTISVRDVKFRNKKGFCFIEPELKEKNGRRLMKGIDYSEELVYTYGTDAVLQDGTIRFSGEEVKENDIPTAGELEDAVIVVTAFGKGNYTGSYSASYRILNNSSLFEQEETEWKLKANRTTLILDKLYPGRSDTIKLASKEGELLEEKIQIRFEKESMAQYFSLVLKNGILTCEFIGNREELKNTVSVGKYKIFVSAVVKVEEEEVVLPEREFVILVEQEMPQLQVSTEGSIDLLYRDETAAYLNIHLISEKDEMVMPESEMQMFESYHLKGKDALNFRIDYERSVFSTDSAKLCIQAQWDSKYVGEELTEEEQLSPQRVCDFTLEIQTKSNLSLEQDVNIVPMQTAYEVTAKTEKCYIKSGEQTGQGQILFISNPEVVYEKISIDQSNVSVEIVEKALRFTVQDMSQYQDGDILPVKVKMKAKGAGKDTAWAEMMVSLVFCENTELEQLFLSKDFSEKTLEERKEESTSYEKTLETNQFDKKVIAANTIDFSNIKIAFLGDSITEGVGIEDAGIENNVYCSVAGRALGVKEVYRFGFGGKSISHYWDSLIEDYRKIPEDADIIFVLAGVNDIYAGSEANFGSISNLYASKTFCADTYELMTGLQRDYPEARIIFLTPLSTVTNEWYLEMLPNMLPMVRYVNVIKALAEREELPNIEVWDLYNSNLLDSYEEAVRKDFMYDGVHPGVNGHKVLGEHIASELIRRNIMAE